ncbi:MAG TPA: hypothetical protein VNH65_14825 [Candidatus Acidoferrum sp.]|nr:hypothetical protein [Candidatus Acidoferrum sp.]
MTHDMNMPWLVLLALGAFHGINPGMGWLFAVALGLQERRRSGVLSALLPLGLGHGLAVAAALVAALLLGVIVPLQYLRWIVAGILIPLGISRMIRHRHPRWASMQVGMGRLTLWSFLMASAHGAGLMVVPVFLGISASSSPMVHHHMEGMLLSGASTPSTSSTSAEGGAPNKEAPASYATGPAVALFATALHSLGYLLVTAFVALLVYEKLGLELLRKAWFNLDLLWAISLTATGVIGLLV